MGGGTSLGSGGGEPGVYGTLGTPASTNLPGSRRSAVTWTDSNGNLWLFGGFGDDSSASYRNLNDLWQFNPSTKQWDWISGSSRVTGFWGDAGVYGTLGKSAAGNVPSGRFGAVGWADSEGNLWLFGGWGCESDATNGFPDTCRYNDLWKFNPTSSEWGWIGGSSDDNQPGLYGIQGTPAATNIPGARQGAVGWTDSMGNFWLFGGYGYDASGSLRYLNDLWKFNVSTLQWSWIGGSSKVNNSVGQPGNYGTVGTPATANAPGGRANSAGWTDIKGNLWLFGGQGVDSTGTTGDLNDLWMFDTSTSQWTWIGGGSKCGAYGGQPGIYGRWMTPSAGNQPGGRYSTTDWTDSNGNLWLYGGFGVDSAGAQGELDDLWEFNTSTREWTWVGGNARLVRRSNGERGEPAVYGTLQTPNFANIPGGLDSAVSWTDRSGHFWLFGGQGYDSNGSAGLFNDLWEYQPGAASLPLAATPSFSPDTGNYAAEGMVTISDATPGASIYYFIDGSPAPAQYTSPITIPATSTIEAIAVATGYATSAVATATYTIPETATPTFDLPSGTYSAAQTTTIADATPGAVIYYALNETPTSSSNVYSGPIIVSASATIEAMAVAPGYANSAIATPNYTIWPASALNEWAWMKGSSSGAAPQVYGTLGVPAIGNIPAARERASTWADWSGNLWLFGGESTSGGLNDLWKFAPSTNEWTWMGGNVGTNCTAGSAIPFACSQPGIYGAIGTPAAGNIPGGRRDATTWVDGGGNLWLFGGHGVDADGTPGLTILNDLWKFDTALNQWSWMSGNSTVSNCFIDQSGETNCAESSVYGTLGVPAAQNTPGGREGATGWTDINGNFWLFGGWSFDVSTGVQYFFNELWKFNPSTGQWTWMGGSSTREGSACFQNVNLWYPTCGEPGSYGTIVESSSGNIPGGRSNAAGWTDRSGNLWLFSGNGFDANGYFGDPNDLWEFNPTTDRWAWMGGSNVIFACSDYKCSPPGNTGVQGTPAAGNIPRGRDHASAWTDSKGNLWLFGGEEFALTNNVIQAPYDLWEFTPSANEWTWMGNSGSNATLQGAVYGTLGTPAVGNGPGNRYGAASWTDGSGSLWLFGGNTPFGTSLYANDLWRYSPSAPAPVPSFAVIDLNDPGFNKTATFTVQAGTSGKTTINTVVAGAFNDVITLSALGLPSGVTASFSPDSITGFGASEVTVSVATGVAPANYTLTVAGTSAGVTETTPVSLAVTTQPPPSFILGASTSSLTVRSGTPGTMTLTVTPQFGFSSAVSFTCSAPHGTTCAFKPAAVTPLGGPVTTILTISEGSASAAFQPSSSRLFPLTTLAVVVCLSFKKRRRLLYIGPVVAISALTLVCGCGGGSTAGSGSTPTPITSTVTITATSANLVQTTTLSLTVD